jgi:vacuolar-type H+-ATPase subunit E/Vma4
MSTCKQLLEEIRRDEELRRALAEELLPEALRHRKLRRTMLLALSREIATKEDVESLRKATREDIEGLRKATKEDIESLRKATREDIESLRRATKEDIEKLKAELKSYIDEKVNSINLRVSDLYGVVKASLVAIVVTLASTILVPLMLRVFL